MLKNHIIFAIRIFWKDKIYSILNILGLTLGISVGIILLLFLQNELTYDSHHENKDQIYRLTIHLKAQGADFNTAVTARELAPVLKNEFPEVLNYVRFDTWSRVMVSTHLDSENPAKYYEDEIVDVDSSYLSIFSHEILEGDENGCLTGPGKAVLTESIAKKFFKNESAIGQVIQVGNEETKRTVTAVISDLPDNSHLKYKILLSDIERRGWLDEQTDPERISEGYWNPDLYTYLLLPQNYNTEDFNKKFEGIFDKYFKAFGDRIGGSATPLLQPLEDIHFTQGLTEDQPNGNMNYVYTFSTIGLFLILLACINYMNLATARSVYRAGEMGIRKVLGFTRMNLFWSVLTEALVLSTLAMIFSIIICYVVLYLTPFNSWIDKDLSISFINNPVLLIGSILITLLVGFVSGIYPALYIPAVPVVAALKGAFIGQSRGIILRKALIIFQFAISIFVIVITVLMDKQIDYMRKVDVGFNTENVVVVDIRRRNISDKMDVVRNELNAHPNIISSSNTWGVPGIELGGQVFRVQDGDEMVQKNMNTIHAGKTFIETIGFEMVQGESFRDDMTEENMTFLVNESGARELGWGDDAVNKKVRFFHGDRDFRISGVVKDFNFESLHNKIGPVFIIPSTNAGGTLLIRVNGTEMQATIDHIEQVITKFDSKNPFEYRFLDAEFDAQYKADEIQHQLLSTLSYICIVISLLGLVGLSAFTVSQKAKEISIRKTLGATIPNVLVSFSKGYLQLMILAAIIAIPIADFVIVDWLSEFAYQMNQQWWYYAIPTLVVLLFGLGTVSIQVFKAAKANPVDGLRSE